MPEKAREALRTALDAWKAGAKIESLATGSPEIIAQDFDWMQGKKLVSYKVEGDGLPQDANLRVDVELELADDAGATCSHGGTDGDFAATRSGAGEQEIGDVHAGDEEHETYGAEKKQERGARVLHNLILQADHADAGAGVVVGILEFEAFRDAEHFRGGLFPGDAGLQAGQGKDAGMPVAIDGESSGPGHEGEEDVGLLGALSDYAGRLHDEPRRGRAEEERAALLGP